MDDAPASPAPPRAPASRRALTFIVTLVLIDSVGFGVIIPVLPGLIMEVTGEGVGQAAIYGGWLFFAFAVMQFFAAPVLGALSDRFGRRPVLMFSLAAFGADYLVMGFAPTLGWLFLGRALSGIAGATYVPAYAYVADVTPPAKRAQTLGLVGAAFGIGFIVGPAFGGVLGLFGPRAPFFAAAVLAFANLALGLFALPESLPREQRRAFAWRRANPVGALLHLRRYPAVLGIGAALFLWALATQVFPTTWSFYTIQQFGWSVALVGASLAFAGLVMVVSQAWLTRVLIPRLGERRSAEVGLVVGATGFAGYAFATQGWMMFAVLPTWALGGLVMPAMNAMMSARVPPDGQGELQGANASLFSLGSIVAPPILTQLFGHFSRPDAVPSFPGMAFLAAALLALAAAVVLLRVPRRTPAPAPAPPALAAAPVPGEQA